LRTVQAILSYMARHGLSQAEFGAKVGVSQGMVWQWLNGMRKIGAERAVKIEKRTRGKLRREQLRPDLFVRRAA
jgi:DNA-binding transcriptional regulator YdaS (Cro superfamily)